MSLETKLDLPELEQVDIKYDSPVFSDNKMDDANDDYKFLREKMRYFMASGEFILNKAINALNSDPNPRIIESSSLILRNILKISDNILNLHKETKIILKEDKVEETKKDGGKITASLVDIISAIQKNKK